MEERSSLRASSLLDIIDFLTTKLTIRCPQRIVRALHEQHMPEYKYSINNNEFITIESVLCKKVLGMPEREAVSLIEKNGRIAFVEKRDSTWIKPECPTGHSYRINLSIKKGKVSSVSIG